MSSFNSIPYSPALDVLVYAPEASPRERGRQHGEQWREAIAELTEIRTRLAMKVGVFSSAAEVERVARQHLPILQDFDPDLHAELVGIAEGSGRSPEQIVILNHYTDLRDIVPERDPAASYTDECSVLYAPQGDDDAVLAMTWDTHASATRFGLLLGIPGDDARPAQWMLSTVGCLGMAGLNARGVGLVVNNLKSTDAHVGIVWPALVRRALAAPTAEAARDVVSGAPLGSGHHYLVGDPRRGIGLETSGRRQATTFDGRGHTYFHTNHCLDEAIGEVTTVSPISTTYARFATLEASLRESPRVAGLDDAWHRLSLVSAPGDLARDDLFATCSAIAMDLGAATARARRGPVVDDGTFQTLAFDGTTPTLR